MESENKDEGEDQWVMGKLVLVLRGVGRTSRQWWAAIGSGIGQIRFGPQRSSLLPRMKSRSPSQVNINNTTSEFLVWTMWLMLIVVTNVTNFNYQKTDTNLSRLIFLVEKLESPLCVDEIVHTFWPHTVIIDYKSKCKHNDRNRAQLFSDWVRLSV